MWKILGGAEKGDIIIQHFIIKQNAKTSKVREKTQPTQKQKNENKRNM